MKLQRNRIKIETSVLISFALFVQLSRATTSENLNANYTNLFAEKSFDCLDKYFAIHFKETSNARFSLIREPFLHRSKVEEIFLRKSNEKLYNPIALRSIASIDDIRRENYLIFLSSADVRLLQNISIPKVHVDSFLYVFYEQTDLSISSADVHSIFAVNFQQNVVIAVSSRVTRELFKFDNFRALLLKCGDKRQYKMTEIGQCRGDEEFEIFPLKHSYTASCVVQVVARKNPPFVYYDPIRGTDDGIEFKLIRTILGHLQMPFEITVLNSTMHWIIIMNEVNLKNASDPHKSSKFLK